MKTSLPLYCIIFQQTNCGDEMFMILILADF